MALKHNFLLAQLGSGRSGPGANGDETNEVDMTVTGVQEGETRWWVQLGCLSAGGNEKGLSTKIAASRDLGKKLPRSRLC